jgi:hypothetical protein
MRTDKEIKLLKARQITLDRLGAEIQSSVVNVNLYKRLQEELTVFEELLREERTFKYKKIMSLKAF